MQELVLTQPGGTLRNAASDQRLEREAVVREAFERNLAECGPLAFRVAHGVLRNTADAEDVAQEAVLRAFERFGRLRDPDRFRAWLVRITFRLALDRARSLRRQKERETRWSRPERRAPVATAEDLAARSEFEKHLERALEELPEKLRLVLLLAAMREHSLEEVAVMLRVPVGTVKSRLFFARRELAEKLRCHVKNTKRP
jgi:RNA polymerase sigma-70 factor (ECF subfamily)